jgi:uncharacterized SAM-dependent methyltransferase
MASTVSVTIHNSQFPEKVRRDLLESLRARRINHKFHYDSVKQTQRWLALHQACSPSRTDPACAAVYDRSFAAAWPHLQARKTHVIGLGCGGGQKDTRLLMSLKSRDTEVFYTPCDVSVAMVLVARQTALAAVAEENCFPVVCDLATADDLPDLFASSHAPGAPRLLTFFGMIPNFEPAVILPRINTLLRSEDALLCSANLAPGNDYASGLMTVMPQYDNEPTREWLMTFLLDLGVARDDGAVRFGVEDDPAGSGLKCVAADFHFLRPRELQVHGEHFEFHPGESIRLFYSYRYTPELVRSILPGYGLHVLDQWLVPSGEEGVFLCQRLFSCSMQ